MTLGSDEQLPVEFGKYVLTRLIATGGMAEIFLAHEKAHPDQPMVIKRILPHLIESSEFVSMFLDEARIAAQLHHENVVEIFDVGRVEGAYFIGMEYVHGEDIRRIYNQAYKRQQSLPLSHSIRIIAEAAIGLGFAHRLPDLTGKPLGLVHRDVSPQNILVSYQGGVKVVDFGIAKAASKVSETRAGVLKGKYSYMSPEQATGDPLDHRTDIFALGIILYETTTGTRLFKRHNELATLQAIMRGEIKPPSEALRGYPLELENILLKALALEAGDRYQEAEDFSRDLFQFLRNSGLFIERSDIAEFMIDLFQGEPGLALHPGSERYEAKPRNDTRPALGPEPNQAQPVSEGQILERDMSVTRADRSDSENEDQEREDSTAESVGFEEAAPLSAPGFVDDHGFSAADNTVAETHIDDVIPKTERRSKASVERVSAHPAMEAAYQRPGPAKDEMATVAVARAYQADQAKEDRQAEAIRGRARPQSTPAPRLSIAQTTTKSSSVKLWIGIGSLLCGLAGIAWIVSTSTKEPLSTPSPSELVRENKPRPVLKPISRRAEAQKASLRIQTAAGATIMHQDRVLGVADNQGQAGPFVLPTGRARLRASLADQGFERFLTVYVPEKGAINVDLRPRQARFRLKINAGAQIELNGKNLVLGPDPVTLFEGTHHLLIVHHGLKKRFETMIRLSAGEQKLIDIDLERVGEDL